MEEPSPAQTTPPPTELPIPNPHPNTTQNLPPSAPPPPPPPPPPTLPQVTKKRPFDQNGHIQDSKYFKMRAVLKDLRPHFMEVLRTPVFHNCKASHAIQEQMKLLMDLYKEMATETIPIGKCKNVPEGPLSSDQEVKPVVQPPPPPGKVFSKTSEQKPALLANLSEMQTPQGTYIVGGSNFGWNFITYLGSKPVYYGRTKETFRAANVIPPQ